MRGKLRTSILDDRQRNPMHTYNFIDVKIAIVLAESIDLTAKKARRLSHPITYHPNGVMLSAGMR